MNAQTHDYLSTACLHGHHGYCAAMVGAAGAKRPGRCKFCEARCRCACHDTTTWLDEPAPTWSGDPA